MGNRIMEERLLMHPVHRPVVSAEVNISNPIF